MAQFYPISRDEMSTFLSGQGFQPLPLPGVKELVWGKRVDRDGQPLSLRVYSGINPSGNSRGCGEDAIRVEVHYRDADGTIHRIGGSKRVHRVKGWKTNLQARIDDWENGLGPKCPKCGAPMRLREPKAGHTWRPFYGCVRWKPKGAGCDGTAQVPRDPDKPTALPTREEIAEKKRKQKSRQPRRSKPSPPRASHGEGDGEMPWERDDRRHREMLAAEAEVLGIEACQI